MCQKTHGGRPARFGIQTIAHARNSGNYKTDSQVAQASINELASSQEAQNDRQGSHQRLCRAGQGQGEGMDRQGPGRQEDRERGQGRSAEGQGAERGWRPERRHARQIAAGIRMRVSCFECALRACGLFKPVSQTELAVINDIKRQHLSLPAGSEIISAGQHGADVYTLYAGWAFRFKNLPDGRRQILNFLLPGDLVGLQAGMFDAAQHGIEALTNVELCLLPRQKVWDLFGRMPELAFDVTWLGAREEGHVDENLLSAGQRSAAERIAALIVILYKRAEALALVKDRTFVF